MRCRDATFQLSPMRVAQLVLHMPGPWRCMADEEQAMKAEELLQSGLEDSDPLVASDQQEACFNP